LNGLEPAELEFTELGRLMFINPEIGFDMFTQALGYATEKKASISLQRLSSVLRCKISFGGCLQE
jgi:hypothetical protein